MSRADVDDFLERCDDLLDGSTVDAFAVSGESEFGDAWSDYFIELDDSEQTRFSMPRFVTPSQWSERNNELPVRTISHTMPMSDEVIGTFSGWSIVLDDYLMNDEAYISMISWSS